jgi:serine/threonine-protein kinase HipA
VNQHHAQKLAGRKRKPGDMDRRHWDLIANEVGLGARGVRLRVQELIDAMVGSRVAATATVAEQPGATAGIVDEVAALIEGNALRKAGRM